MVKVAINGFGRIGRLAFRQMLLRVTLLTSTKVKAKITTL